MLCSRRPPGELALAITALPLFGALALWLVFEEGGLDRALGALALVLLLCLLPNLVGPGRYCIEGGALVWGRTRLPLEQIRRARVAPLATCPLFPVLKLVLTNEGVQTLALPLTYAGWEEVYEAIRAARPDLGLLPWWEEPEIRRALKLGGHSLLRFPKDVTFYRENGTVALFTSALLFLALTLLGAFLPKPLREVWIGVVVFATLTLYHRLAKPRILVKDGAGRLKTSEAPRAKRASSYFPYFSSAFSTKALV